MATEHAQQARWQNELLPHIVDHLSRVRPDAIYAEYPHSPTTYAEGYRAITYRQFANAINGCARWLVDTLGPGQREVLPYIGSNDVRYPVLIWEPSRRAT